ncbi:hypothetical protein [Synechococcus sp. PCC 7336]|uniref:hypothetical protein n=1 Tax=Synechococcus sp. PCC 7336 TaxID=195250 RepID=UPI0003498BAC|nr:hypothetical protein [Synechococcus sp. PCC 7336]
MPQFNQFEMHSSQLIRSWVVGLGWGLALTVGIHPIAWAQSPPTAIETEEEESENGERESEAIATGDRGLQLLLEALEEEPDLGPIPLQPVAEEPSGPSPFRLFVDMEVRGSTNAAFEPDPDADLVFLPSVTFVASPSIAQNAQLIASLSGGNGFYADRNDLEFGFISGSIGVNWDFAPFAFTRVELIGQQFFSFDNDDFRSLTARFQIGSFRFFFDNDLFIRYFYQLDGSLTSENDLDRLGNSMNVSLLYPLSSRLQGRFNYRILLSSFEDVPRTDLNNQVRGEVRYAINSALTVRGFASFTNNLSTDNDRDYDEFSYGLGLTTSLPVGGRR